MAEVSTGNTVNTDIYRPQPQQNPLAMITQIGQASDALGKISLGGAMQGALDPESGTVDQNKLLSMLRQTPAGAAQAVPAMDALARLRQAGFAADQAGVETLQKRMALTSHLFSGLASNPNASMKDVNNIAAAALDPKFEGEKYGVTLPLVMNVVKSFQTLPKDRDGNISPKAIQQKALEMVTQAGTTAEVLSQHSPKGRWVDRGGNMEFVTEGTTQAPATGAVVPKNLPPETPVASPKGPRYLGEQPAPMPAAVVPPGTPGSTAPTAPRRVGTIPVPPGTNRAAAPPDETNGPSTFADRFQPPRALGPAAGLEPGYTEAASGIATQSANSANELTRANDTSPNRKGLLGNMEDLISKFRPGVGSDWELFAKNFGNRNIPVPKSWQENGGPLDLKSVASQEEFNKLAVTLAQQQFAAIGGTGTDAKFNSAYETSPHQTLSGMGNKNIIRLLKGNEDAINAKNRAWQNWLKDGNGPHTYAQFSVDFNDNFDPRVFQMKYVPAKDRQNYLDAMDPAERQRLLSDVTYARKQGWVKF